MIPSAEEADRLAKDMPRCRKVVLEGRSHAVLQEAGVDLVKILQVRATAGQWGDGIPICHRYVSHEC